MPHWTSSDIQYNKENFLFKDCSGLFTKIIMLKAGYHLEESPYKTAIGSSINDLHDIKAKYGIDPYSGKKLYTNVGIEKENKK